MSCPTRRAAYRAWAANVGSAATRVCNPQNILFGEHGGLDFWHYLAFAAPVSALGLVLVFLVVWAVWRRALGSTPTGDAVLDGAALARPTLDRPALLKGLGATILLPALYPPDLPPWPSPVLAAALLPLSRPTPTRQIPPPV